MHFQVTQLKWQVFEIYDSICKMCLRYALGKAKSEMSKMERVCKKAEQGGDLVLIFVSLKIIFEY